MAVSSVQFGPQNRDLGVLTRDVDEDLAIYLGLRNDDDIFLLPSETSQYEVVQMATTVDNEWLIAEPDLSVLPSVENKELQVVKSEPQPANNTSEESVSSRSELKSSTAASDKRPSSSSSRSRKPNSRPSTTTVRRQTLPSKSKPSTPSSRSTLPSSSKPKPDQATVLKPSSIAKPSSRSSTPTRKISSGQKAASNAVCKNPTSLSSSASGVGSSETVQSKPSTSRDLLSLSRNAAVQNPKVSLPNKRPVSASRGRPSSTNSTSSSTNNNNGKVLRRKSCSPAKTRAPHIASGGNKTGSIVILSRARGHGNNGLGDDDVINPVLIGTKMVERVVNMRKLAPPKQDPECVEDDKPRRYAKDNGSSGFGRSLSNKSLDMAIRHMDIRRSMT